MNRKRLSPEFIPPFADKATKQFAWALHNRRRRERLNLIGPDVDAAVKAFAASPRAGDQRIADALRQVLGPQAAAEVISTGQRGSTLTLVVACAPVAYRLQRDDGERLLKELNRTAPEARIRSLRVQIGG